MRALPIVVLLILAGCRASGSASSGEVMRVVPLQHAAAPELADELNRLAAPGIGAGPDVEAAYTLVADARTNSVIVKTSPADLEHLLAVIGELDHKVEAQSR